MLHEAISKNQPELLAVLLEYGAPPDTADDVRLTPLMFAVETQQTWAIAPLLAAGTDPNAVEPQDGVTALSLALENANDDALDALLANSRTDAHATPGSLKIPYVFRAKTAHAVRALVAAGCSVSNTTLLLAASRALPRCLAVLDAQGLDWFAPAEYGQAKTAMDALGAADPSLAAHGSNVLHSRSTAQSLEHQLPTVPVSRPPRM